MHSVGYYGQLLCFCMADNDMDLPSQVRVEGRPSA